MNTLKNTIKRPFGYKGVKPLSGGKFKAIGSNILNAILGRGAQKRVYNALQNNDLLFKHTGIIIGHKETSFVGVLENATMDEAGGYGNVPASTGKGYI